MCRAIAVYYHYVVAKSVVFLGILLLSTALDPSGFVFGQSLDALNSVHQFREVAISPDGATVAWTEMILAKEGSDPRRSVIFIKDLRDPAARPRPLLKYPWSGKGLAWSRDGKLAFLSNGGTPGQLQLYTADKPGTSKPRKLNSAEA